ncbi:MAG TPA: redoxin domain-containing protein [Bacteroidales bacterium]|nr:redoxin domain-containing protein [Bacteroidales bacterium]
MRKNILVLFILMIPLILKGQQSAGYLIDVSIRGLSDSTIYLAYHFGEKQYLKDTTKLDKSGKAVFKGKETLPQGIYMIVLPGKKYFEILLSEDQIFSIDCLYTDYTGTLKFTGSTENSAFVDYQKKWVAMQQSSSGLAKRIQNNKENKDSLAILTELQKSTEQSMKAYLKKVVSENNDNLLAVLVNSLIPIDIPEFKAPAGIANQDSVKWLMNYNYNKNHFFDNIDLKDERLLRTPILYARLNAFFTGVVIQAPDSINREIDKLIKKVEGNYKVFQYVCVYLFNHFRESEIMGHDAVMVKLADDIYLTPKADWVTKEFKEDLKKQIDLIRPNLIGKTAQNLIMNSYKGIYVALDDVNKDFTILYFWEPNCGHCQEATPKLKTWYDQPKDYTLEVFAVCTTDEKDKWTKYIEDNKLTWINGWDPQRSSHFDYYYNVQSTPMVYILDKNKKIIAKKISVEDIGGFIDNYRKYFK